MAPPKHNPKRFYAKRVPCTDANMGAFKWVVIDRETDQAVNHFHEFPMYIQPRSRQVMSTEEIARDAAKHRNTMHEGRLKEKAERAKLIAALRQASWAVAFTDEELADAFAGVIGWDQLLVIALILLDRKAGQTAEPRDMNRCAEMGHKIAQLIDSLP